MTIILDPTDERRPVARQLTPRTGTVSGRLALLDIAKPRGSVLLDRLEARLSERLPGIRVQRYAKPTFTRPAPDELRREIARDNDFVVEALAD
ncbi:MAG: hypothetical protein KDI31_20155 [Pseudomonadales bacterium]|nr:hypothetical protein [Pseudomonadales bacterium]